MKKRSRRKIEIGNVYGKVKVIGVAEKTSITYKKYICECQICGNVFEEGGHRVLERMEKNAPCPLCVISEKKEKIIRDARKYIGAKSGYLEIIDVCGTKLEGGANYILVKCICKKCGNETQTTLHRFKDNNIRECAECNQKHLDEGRKFLKKTNYIDGTSVIAIDGRRKINKNNTTKITGVSYLPKIEKYRAYINFKGKQYHLGCYANIEDAKRAREKAESKIYGNFLEWYSSEFPEQWEKIRKKEV